MFFLFCGEGPTDFGTCIHKEMVNNGDDYLYGPLTIVVDQIVESHHLYSLLDSTNFGFVPRGMITECAKATLRPKPKSIKFPGKGGKKETGYFYRNARVLAQIAIRYGHDSDDVVVSILYQDSDHPNDRGNWEDKVKSVVEGFYDEGYAFGVPMIPKSVSEAWILCAIYKKQAPSRNCDFLEYEKRGSGSQHQLKDRLEKELGMIPDRETLCGKIKTREINFDIVDLGSYVAFKDRLEAVIIR